MLKALLETLQIMGWLGAVLGILVLINIITATILNVWSGAETFNWKKMGKGILKSLIFYLSAAALSVAFTILPFINEMITNSFGIMLLSDEMLETLSSVGVLGVVMSAIVIQGKNAISSVLKFANISTNVKEEEITWEVEEEEE